MVVLDEADRMADMGFLPEVKRLLDACATPRQTLLFSATLDGDVDVIIRRYMHDPVKHEEAGADPEGDTAEHLYWSVERPDRVDLVARIVSRTGPTIVFCRTKRGADRVAKQLGSRGVAAVAIHGDRSQNQRERALEDFRGGRARAIIATDVAARGIHVDGVSCVIHFDPSEDAKDYVHRSGRTGRAGAAGTVISLVSDEQRRDMTRQQRGLGRKIEVRRAGAGPADRGRALRRAGTPTGPAAQRCAGWQRQGPFRRRPRPGRRWRTRWQRSPTQACRIQERRPQQWRPAFLRRWVARWRSSAGAVPLRRQRLSRRAAPSGSAVRHKCFTKLISEVKYRTCRSHPPRRNPPHSFPTRWRGSLLGSASARPGSPGGCARSPTPT